MEGSSEEMTGNDAVESAQIRRKESDHSLKPGSYNMLEPPAMLIPDGGNWPKSAPPVYTDTLEGQSLNRCVSSIAGSESPYASHCFIEEGAMVEELTLRNYKSPNTTVVGSSNSREGMQIRQGQWQHLYRLAGGSGSKILHGDTVSRDKDQAMASVREDVGSMSVVEFCAQKPVPCKQPCQDHAEISEHLINRDNKIVSNNALSPGGTRTKILSASGFSQFFVKNTLKGKGVLHRNPEAHYNFGVSVKGHNNEKDACVTRVASDASLNSNAKTNEPSQRSNAGSGPDSFHDGISLREWLRPGYRKINKVESLHMFRQVVALVDLAHCQGVALQDLRSSCFKLLPSNRVKYVGSSNQRDLLMSVMDQDIPNSDRHLSSKRPLEQGMRAYSSLSKQQKLIENMKLVRRHPRLLSKSGFNYENVNEVDVNFTGPQDSEYEFRERHNPNTEHKSQKKSGSPSIPSTCRHQLASVDVSLEEKWYSSPEELNEKGCTFSSNIYGLGVLLFEFLCCFESWEEHAAVMLNLRHRILPPKFLSENPKEAGFCLWLLHPEPSSRPTTREILQSELICGSQELSSRDELPKSVGEDDVESELLLHFLESLEEQKQKHASKLSEDIRCLEADIEEVGRRHLSRSSLIHSSKDFHNAREKEFLFKEPFSSELLSRLSTVSNMNEARLMRNFNQLENAYFSMRSQIQLPETDATTRSDKDILKKQERWSLVQNENEDCSLKQNPTDRIGAFFDGLCKYARYSKFEVRGTLRNGDLLNSPNVICSLSFDRDEDYFAAAGVSKKIKIFEFDALLNDSVDIHYPVIEMSSKSKLSCVCWNNYIKNYLASTNYDGVVQKKCINTIWNAANVCCVQFSAHSTHLLAFGSANYKTYCYDLRNTRIPWCTLAGHGKAVSNVKFLDQETLVSASTDNTLKLWDLNKTSSSESSTNACSLTFSGHTNEKNFVGLSISDGYIACGSETNEIYAYYKSLPMPITSHKFGSVDPISGQETGDDNGQFVSSVCWRGKSSMVVVANSSGSIKLLQMV
ncbi:hypothetical protein HHK36_029106 [Tetracentron sinense]|uniref:Protein kinase domain-containing protein n=1 Tax=Tetracentron sinense TaxID=13715 RepID=A0A835D113_TETSI|nr:hypothetical protein HHK36_029106 [Tetracentron sinense]